jgi:phage gpG-like protein
MAEQTVEQLGVDLARLGDRAEAMAKDVLQTLANFQLRQIRENFRTETDPDGTPWPPLSPLTLRNRSHGRRMLYGDSNPVQLVRSVPDGRDAIKVGTNDPILSIHHTGARQTITRKQAAFMFYNLFGGTGGPGPFGMEGKELVLPRRRGVGFRPSDPDEHAKIVANYLGQAVGGAG